MYVAFAVLDLTNSVISETQTNEIYVLTVNVYNLNTGIRSLTTRKRSPAVSYCGMASTAGNRLSSFYKASEV